MKPYKPEFTFDVYARKQYYEVLAERERYNDELITYEEFLFENGEWLEDYYERILSE
jgi:hypothetical protein